MQAAPSVSAAKETEKILVQTGAVHENIPTENTEKAISTVQLEQQEELDKGNHVMKANPPSDVLKSELLTQCWTPPESYDFGPREFHH